MFSITLLANAGLLIDTGRLRMLVDGIYSETGHTFSTIPKDIEKRLIEGGGEFDNIQYLLFTHLHPDHFDRHKAREFIENNKVSGVFFPLEDSCAVDIEMKEFIAELHDNKTPIVPLSLKRGEQRRITIDSETEVTAFGTGHMGVQYSDVPNICYLITSGGKTLLITGDADFQAADFAAAGPYGQLDAVAVNPMFYQAKQGAELIGRLAPKQLIIYHIPFEGQDEMNLRRMVQRQMQRHANECYTIVPLLQTMQNISLI